MRNTIAIVTFGIVGGMVIWLNCGVDVTYAAAIKSTANMIKVKAPLVEIGYGIIGIVWTWMVETPEGEGVLVEKSVRAPKNFVISDTVSPVDTVMKYFDTDTTGIKPKTTYFYRLSLLKDGEQKEFATVKVKTPSYIEFILPKDTVSSAEDSLVVRWKGAVDSEGELIKKYTVSLRKGSWESFLKPIVKDTIPEAIPQDTVYEWKYPLNGLPKGLYTIEVTGTRLVEYITDTSKGIRTFLLL